MKNLFTLLLLFISLSAFAQDAKVKATVTSIQNDKAIIKTSDFAVEYWVDSKDVELEKEYWFKLTKIEQLDHFRRRRATIIGTPVKTCKTVTGEAKEYLASSKL